MAGSLRRLATIECVTTVTLASLDAAALLARQGLHAEWMVQSQHGFARRTRSPQRGPVARRRGTGHGAAAPAADSITRTQEPETGLELAHLKRMRFGTKSEALTSEQKILFEDDADQDLAAIQAELDAEEPAADTTGRQPRTRAGRQLLPKHLERVDVRHEPEACACAHCQRDLVKISEDVSEPLDIEPARFFVIRHIRPQYACEPSAVIPVRLARAWGIFRFHAT